MTLGSVSGQQKKRGSAPVRIEEEAMHNTKTSRLSVCFFMMVLVSMVAMELGPVAHAQTSCTAPPSLNQYWAPNTTITVYIDPSLSQQVQQGVQEAITDWSSQTALTGNNIQLKTTATDPGANAQNTVRVLNDPANSPGKFATTATNVVTQNGVSTTQMFNAPISVNTGSTLPNTTTPDYDPQGANAATFLNDAFDHEFGACLWREGHAGAQ